MGFSLPFEETILGNRKKMTMTGAFAFAAGSFFPQTQITPYLPLDLIGAGIMMAVAGYSLVAAMKSTDKLEEDLDEVEGLPKRQKGALKGAGSSLPEAGISGILGGKGNGVDGFLNAPFSNFVNPLGLLWYHMDWMRKTGRKESIKATNKQQLTETKLAAVATVNTLLHGFMPDFGSEFMSTFVSGFGPTYFLTSALILGAYYWSMKQADKREKEAKKARGEEPVTETEQAQDQTSEGSPSKSSKAAQWGAVGAAMVGVVGLAGLAGAAAMYSIGVGTLALPALALGGLTLPLLAAFASSIPEFLFTRSSYNAASRADKEAGQLRQQFEEADEKPDSYYEKMDELEKISQEDRAEGMQNVMVSALVNMTLVSGMGAGMYSAFGHGTLHMSDVLGSIGLEGAAAFGAVGAVVAPSLALMAAVMIGSRKEKYDPVTGDLVRKPSNPRLSL